MLWNFFRKSNLEAVFFWLSGIVTEGDIILVDLGGKKNFFQFKFPLRYGGRPKEISNNHLKPTFVISYFKTLNYADQEWEAIFSSPEVEIYESKKRFNDFLPLRWGLNEEEKKEAFKIARDALDKFLNGGEFLAKDYFQKISQRFMAKADLCVAIWVKGQLRGSAVVEKFCLGEGIAQGACLASRDKRFKPLSLKELPEARIEITVFKELRLPLSEKERKKNVIYPEKGYLLEKHGKKGWYLPEVFNVRKFKNLDEFLGDLAQEKAGLNRESYRDADVFIFEVDDFIESKDLERPLALYGPVIKPSLEFNTSDLKVRLRLAADWLCSIQENDGNFPPIINPLNGQRTQIDRTRLAFTALSLAETGKILAEEKYIKSAEKILEYIATYSIADSNITRAYAGQLALSLGRDKDAAKFGEDILKNINQKESSPIGHLQVATLFSLLAKTDKKFLEIAISKVSDMAKDFEEKKSANKEIFLALYPEMIHSCLNIFKITNGQSYEAMAHKMGGWLVSFQLPNGAFPESTFSDFVYTRGSGKVFEVLALFGLRYKEAIQNSLRWIFSMQYNEENTFFVPEKLRGDIIGAFRHDYFNQEAWIDSAGHFILGVARLLSHLNDLMGSVNYDKNG